MPRIRAWAVVAMATGLALAVSADAQPVGPAAPPSSLSNVGVAVVPGSLLQIKNATRQTVACRVTVGGVPEGFLRLKPRGEHVQPLVGPGEIALLCPDLPAKAYGPLRPGVRYVFLRRGAAVALAEVAPGLRSPPWNRR